MCLGAPSFQHLHLWSAKNRLQKVCIFWRSSNHACWWRLAGSGRGANQNMATIGEYLQTWKLNISTTKTVLAIFLLNNKEAKRKPKINPNNEILPFCSQPKYLGVTLDMSLTYRRHLESLRKKLTSRVALLRRLAGSGLVAGATTLRTATLALLHSTAENCPPVWCRSAHSRLIDPAITDALRIVIGCLRPTPANNPSILAGIQPADLRRNGATLSLAHSATVLGLDTCSTQSSPVHRVQITSKLHGCSKVILQINSASDRLRTILLVCPPFSFSHLH